MKFRIIKKRYRFSALLLLLCILLGAICSCKINISDETLTSVPEPSGSEEPVNDSTESTSEGSDTIMNTIDSTSNATENSEPTDSGSDTTDETPPSDPSIVHGFKVNLELEKDCGLNFAVTDDTVVTRSPVWARSEPSNRNGDTTKVTVLAVKTTVRRIGYTESWSRIVYNNNIYYVSSSYLLEYEPQDGKTDIFYQGHGVNKDIIIAIDAGHQTFGMFDLEPNGPGSDIMKAKVTSGTTGVATGNWEYQLNLDVALLLRDLLLADGYSVVMIRETNNVTVSNVERAEIANKYNTAAFIRIHANGSERESDNGALTVCQTAKNPYNAGIYEKCNALSRKIVDAFCDSTGMKNNNIWETDTMTGTNWCRVPTTIVEMGYMSNVADDQKMATEQFKKDAAQGIFNGLEAYLQKYIVLG